MEGFELPESEPEFEPELPEPEGLDAGLSSLSFLLEPELPEFEGLDAGLLELEPEPEDGLESFLLEPEPEGLDAGFE